MRKSLLLPLAAFLVLGLSPAIFAFGGGSSASVPSPSLHNSKTGIVLFNKTKTKPYCKKCCKTNSCALGKRGFRCGKCGPGQACRRKRR
jgi:tRNA(Ile2) C34 agmatinyltransferase TiaS